MLLAAELGIMWCAMRAWRQDHLATEASLTRAAVGPAVMHRRRPDQAAGRARAPQDSSKSRTRVIKPCSTSCATSDVSRGSTLAKFVRAWPIRRALSCRSAAQVPRGCRTASPDVSLGLPDRRRITDTETLRRVRPTHPVGNRRYDTVAQIK
jgi:hypothetical protein